MLVRREPNAQPGAGTLTQRHAVFVSFGEVFVYCLLLRPHQLERVDNAVCIHRVCK